MNREIGPFIDHQLDPNQEDVINYTQSLDKLIQEKELLQIEVRKPNFGSKPEDRYKQQRLDTIDEEIANTREALKNIENNLGIM